MEVTITISPDEQAAYAARAAEEGLSLQQWLRKLARESVVEESASAPTENLSDLLLRSPFARSGLDVQRLRDFPPSPGIE